MPVLRKYKKNSILYFQGDPKREIFLIKSGRVLVTFKNINDEGESEEILGKGEFFGVRSAIAGMPREETVNCVEDAEILVFSPGEFEGLIKQNPNIGLKILNILSYSLRQIGKEEKKMLTQNAFEDPGNEMFKMGIYFFTQREYDNAIRVWDRFLYFFPNHPQKEEAGEMIEKTKQAKKTGYHPSLNRG
jgi:CRP-like cAMP-binding protein